MTAVGEDLRDRCERERIENDTEANLFVEAGAGSGKTYALVGRICHLVLHDGAELDRIAAITFTEKAAAELRERVRARLAESPESERQKAALAQVDTAAIGTLHSFAARLVAEHPLDAGVPLRVRVVDAMGSHLAFERRWQRIRAALFPVQENQVGQATRVLVAADVTFDRFRDLADRLDRHWDRLTPVDPPVALPVPDIDLILRRADVLLDALADCTDRTDRFAAQLDKVREWRSCLAAARDDEWAAVAAGCPGVGTGGAGKIWLGGTNRVRELREELKQLGTVAREECERFHAAALEIVGGEIIRIVLDEARARRRSGELEFHDLLIHARDILEDPGVQAALHENYQRILLDEFQDTDPLQLDIARRIVAGPDRTGRLFTVGDPKQSIYRFRRADIATYMAARDEADQVVSLTTNFRSTRPVLDWVNDVFGRLIVSDGHLQPGYTPLDPAPGRAEWDTSQGPLPFVFATEDLDEKPTADTVRGAEARDVARVVATALRRGWCKETGRDGDYCHEPVRESDICVLIPARTCLPFLEDALDRAGIEFRAEASSLVYSTQDVHDLLLTARALTHTADEAVLVATLRTPLFGCGDDDLLRWKKAGGQWYLGAEPPLGQEDSPVAEALRYLRTVRRDLSHTDPGSLLARLADERRVFEVSMGSPRHRDVWRRLRFVIDQAYAWYDAERGDLRGYLAWAATQQEEDARVTEAVLPEVGVNAVRIMTMHAAKGLQFPMVVVAGMSSGFRAVDEAALWDEHGRVRLRLSKAVCAPGYQELADVERRHIRAERIRLLYVACTRAESLLAVSGYRSARDGWGALLAAGIEGHPDRTPELIEPVAEQHDGATAADHGVSWQQWEDESDQVEATSGLPASVSATRLAHDPPEPVATLAAACRALVPPPVGPEVVPPATGVLESGTDLGIALHAALESVDLRAPTDESDASAAAVAVATGVRDLDRFVALVRAALTCAPVRRAATREHWRELPLAGVPADSDTVVEGIADLVYREDDGTLVIVDYKTDVAVTHETLEAYWTQLTLYAELLTRAAGERVGALQLVFVRAGEAYVLDRRFGA
ncbi:UvrD-helicase domain-containing protein [Rhodococcus ruber]|uniref:UvrD-helicase domain-containing protein n=1 Tax=Rhodococcus ruber TaxID=1830 RepID=UPI001EEE162D|nr:UvrD-helicase domain-containing protein [Rhodococcus ruber]MCF8783466.1 UvrD-helicase domain-containing protein [Rhodococcus ruber]